MGECIKNCRACPKLVISTAVTFTDDTLVIDLPAGNYGNECKYCILIAQELPDTATITAPVVFTIGGDTTTTYPFLNSDCTPILASQVSTMSLYSTRVNTSVGTGVFKYIGKCKLPCISTTVIQSIPVPTTTTPAEPVVASIRSK